MRPGGTLTKAEAATARAALRHYPAELVEGLRSGVEPRHAIRSGFTQFQVSAVVALLTKTGALPIARAARTQVSAEGLR